MKTPGSLYVSVVLAALLGYFAYQSWFNPQRAVKRQLGELAAALSVPANEHSTAAILARADRIRRFFAPDSHVRLGPSGPEFQTRDGFVASMRAWTLPPGEVRVEFVDVQIALDSSTNGRAYLTIETTALDTRTGELGRDRREAQVGLGRREGDWVITSVELAATTRVP